MWQALRGQPARSAGCGSPILRGGTGSVGGMSDLLVLAQGDPTGFSSPLGQLVVLAALLASLTLLLRWWWQQRRR